MSDLVERVEQALDTFFSAADRAHGEPREAARAAIAEVFDALVADARMMGNARDAAELQRRVDWITHARAETGV